MSNVSRIAKNTLLLYVRMAFIMLVTLYTSRVILESLGVVDFGIYNVVGGLSSAFVFFSSALSNSTQRFLNFRLGEDDLAGAKSVFNNSLIIYSSIALMIIIIGVPLGYWFVTNKLILPAERMDAAIVVYFLTILMFVITMVLSVYDSVLIARENMTVYAFIGIFDALSKLAISKYIQYVHDGDRLIYYAVLLFIAHFIARMIPVIICNSKYEECSIALKYEKHLSSQLFGFIGWNGFGCLVWMINQQFINILINTFFGPIVNAANGIATQVTQAVNNFSVNFFTAVRPQIVKSYAAKDFVYFKNLIYYGSRFSFYLTWIVCLPIMLKPAYILQLWLQNPPEYASKFVFWTLLFSAINVLNNPIWTASQASGKISKFVMVGSLVFLMAFPISFIMLKLGYEDAVIVFQVLCIVRFVYLIVVVKILGENIDFPVGHYIRKVIYPILKVVLLSGVTLCFIVPYFPDTIISLALFVLLSIIFTSLICFSAGMNDKERTMVIAKGKNILRKIFNRK